MIFEFLAKIIWRLRQPTFNFQIISVSIHDAFPMQSKSIDVFQKCKIQTF